MAFCELQYAFLGEQHVALMKKGDGLSLYPHPLCNHDTQVDKPSFLKILPYVVCLCAFSHNDIVVFACRHLYHPWCALIHFRQSSQCAKPCCIIIMSP